MVVRGGHTQEGSRNTPLALLTGHFHSNTHTISVRGKTTLLTRIILLLPLLTPPPHLPDPSHLTILSQSYSINSKLLSPPTIKNQAGCRKGKGRERGRSAEGVSVVSITS